MGMRGSMDEKAPRRGSTKQREKHATEAESFLEHRKHRGEGESTEEREDEKAPRRGRTEGEPREHERA